MSNNSIWMVRAGKGAAFVDDFVEGDFVSIGFPNAGEVTSPVDKAAILSVMQQRNPNKIFGWRHPRFNDFMMI